MTDTVKNSNATASLVTTTTAASPVVLTCERLPAADRLFLRITASVDGAQRWERVISADNAGVQQAKDSLATACGMDVASVERRLSSKVNAELNTPASPAGPEEENFLDGIMDSKAFDKASFPRDWLVESIFVKSQPAIVGGPYKSLKTSVVVDLALSLGLGDPFLGRFNVPKATKVLLLSGESGEATLQETARRIAASKKRGFSDACVQWGFRVPNLTREEDVKRLESHISGNGIGVVIIDPMYLTMPGIDVAAGNVFQMGPLLRRVSQACRNGGATPILVHHTTKTAGVARAVTGEPLELHDLAYSGFSEFARQWILLSRRERYEPGTGLHKLWLNLGGSAGQGDLFGLNVKEGVVDLRFQGRGWDVRVVDAQTARREQAEEKGKAKVALKEQKHGDVRKTILKLIGMSGGDTVSKLAELAGVGKATVGAVVTEMLAIGELINGKVVKGGGKSGPKPYDGVTLSPRGRAEAIVLGYYVKDPEPSDPEGASPEPLEAGLEGDDQVCGSAGRVGWSSRPGRG